jgi:threo-3-hydroxy-L-aspartate ammonia-lyase
VPPSPASIREAAQRLDGVAHRTPLLTARGLRPGLFLKPENLQRTGSFKFRGAYNAVAQLDAADGVCAVSSGNHAQALALAAALHGLPALILMPEDAPASKVAATRGYGAEIVRFDRYAHPDRDALLAELAAERGLERVHPFDDERVMSGAGTVALELLEQSGGLDTLVTPVGGGGLISGCATAVAEHGVRVVGVEPEAGDDVRRSLAAGERVRIEVPRTIADGLQIVSPGERPFAVIKERVAEIVTVTDAELVDTMRFAFERLKLVLEPSGAAALAAVRAGRVEGHQIGVVLSGGNVDLDRFRSLVA